MSNKHFNAANVWGKIVELKEDNQSEKPCVMIQLDCSGKRGTVRAYGRMYGREKTDKLIDFHKNNPGVIVRFRGFISQYEKRDEILTNFTFYQWNHEPNQEPRAAFVLTGELTNIEDFGEETRVTMQVVRKGSGGYDDRQEEFLLWMFGDSLLDGASVGGIVEFKGYMQQGEGEDEFGSATGHVRPRIMKSRVVVPF